LVAIEERAEASKFNGTDREAEIKINESASGKTRKAETYKSSEADQRKSSREVYCTRGRAARREMERKRNGWSGRRREKTEERERVTDAFGEWTSGRSEETPTIPCVPNPSRWANIYAGVCVRKSHRCTCTHCDCARGNLFESARKLKPHRRVWRCARKLSSNVLIRPKKYRG